MAAKKAGRAGRNEATDATDMLSANAANGGSQSDADGRGGSRAQGKRSAGGAEDKIAAAGRKGATEEGATSGGSKTRGKKAAEGTKAASAARSRKATADGAGAGSGGARGRAKAGDTLDGDLRAFVEEHPHGWGHGEWVGLLDRLREHGHDVDDTDRVGARLERQRLSHRLEGIAGVGPSRVRSLVDRFETLWSLRHASVEDIASVTGINRSLAEKIHENVR